MGKGKKRKNPGVGVDFRNVKHKVGKKLPKAQNETSTDFQARSINLPNQSITQDKAGAAVSERNLTLKELVSQLAHHNTATRRDALTGLQQLVISHPAEARRHTALLLEALAPRLSDGEASVRTTLLTTLRCAVLPALGPASLSPFMPLLLAHVSAALTNLSADVRFDALAVLEAVTEAAPQLMAAQLGVGLAHYTGLLSRANRGKSIKSQALSGLLKVVASLDKFLQAALAAAAAPGSSNIGSNANSLAAAAAGAGDAAGMVVDTSSSAETAVLLLRQRVAAAPLAASQVPSAAVLLQLYCPGLADSSTHATTSSSKAKQQQKQKQQQQQWGDGDAAAAAGSSGGSSVPLQQQVLSLLDVLFDGWSEAAPGSLSAAPEAESAQVLVHILNATHLIMTHFSTLSSSSSSGSNTLSEADTPLASLFSRGPVCHGFNTRRDQIAWLQKAGSIVLPKLLKAFPVSPPATHSLGVALYDLLQRFNLLSMQLCAGFMAAGVDWPQQQQQQMLMESGLGYSGEPPLPFVQQEWHARVLEFMAGVLAAGNCLPTIQQATAPAAASAKGKGTPTSSKGKGKQQQQQQQPSPQAAAAAAVAPANSSLSSSSIMVTVLHSLQQLLPQLRGPPRQHILAAVGQLAAAGAGGSHSSPEGPEGHVVLQQLSPAAAAAAGSNAVRSACLGLQLQLLLQHLWQGESVPSEGADIAAWLAAAPRLLYELGTNKPKISQLLLQLLFEAARLCVPGSAVEQQLHALQPQLAALLGTALPPPAAAKQGGQQQQQQQKGGPSPAAAAAGQAVRVMVGPLADLPPACQHRAFDTLAHLPQLTPALLKAVALSCRITSYPDAVVQRLLDGVLSGAGSSMQPDVYISFVATLLDPGAVGGYVVRVSKQQVQAGFTRHQQCVDAACRWLHCYGPLPELLQWLVAPLLQQWQGVQQLWQQQQQQGQAAAGAQQQQVQRHVCGATYSLVALAALGAGCWLPSTNVTTGTTSVSSAAAAAAGDAAEGGVPPGLLSVLPQVLAVHCLCRAGGSTDAFASQAAVNQCLQQLVLPLVYALPSRTLLLPFMQQLVQQGLSQQQQQQQQQQQGIRVVVHVLRVLLHQQGLKLVWLQHGNEVQQLLQQVQATAQQLQDQLGEGSAEAEVEQLQTALAMLCKN